jgi:O-acetylserine/cysteine efflux transporter
MDRITSLSERPRALIALVLAGSTWGLTLPLAAVVLRGASPAWLVSLRFGCAAIVLSLLVGREGMRRAYSTRIALWGMLGYAAVVLLQSEAIERTSVSHAAVLGGIVPALVILIAIARGHQRPSRVVALGLLGAVGGVALFAGSGGHASLSGDALVLLASVFSAIYIFAQPSLLVGRNAVAVTAVQMGAAAVSTLPIALFGESAPRMHGGPLLALIGLVVVGSLLPFTLYAWSQTRVPRELSGAFLNLEALVGGLIGVFAFHDPLGLEQASGMAFLIGGLVLVALHAPPLSAGGLSPRARGRQRFGAGALRSLMRRRPLRLEAASQLQQ